MEKGWRSRWVSVCLNWPVKSSRLEQMQIAPSCLHDEKSRGLLWNELSQWWVAQSRQNRPPELWLTQCVSSKQGAVNWGLRTLQAACYYARLSLCSTKLNHQQASRRQPHVCNVLQIRAHRNPLTGNGNSNLHSSVSLNILSVLWLELFGVVV